MGSPGRGALWGRRKRLSSRGPGDVQAEMSRKQLELGSGTQMRGLRWEYKFGSHWHVSAVSGSGWGYSRESRESEDAKAPS